MVPYNLERMAFSPLSAEHMELKSIYTTGKKTTAYKSYFFFLMEAGYFYIVWIC